MAIQKNMPVDTLNKCGRVSEKVMPDQATIYLAEDESASRIMISTVLSKHYEVQAFESAEDLLQSEVQGADLIVLDVEMGGMSGYEACEELRKGGISIPIIFLSGRTGVDDRLKGYEVGGDDFVSKPFDEEELNFKITRCLDKHKTLRETQKQLQDSNQFAFSAMTNASEIGQIVRFIESTYGAKSFDELADILKEALQGYQLNGLFCLRADNEELYDSVDGKPLNHLEKSILSVEHAVKKVAHAGERCLFSSDNVSILIKDMPADEEKAGRLRDHLSSMLDSASHAVRFIKTQKDKDEGHQAIVSDVRNRTNELASVLDQVSTDAKNSVSETIQHVKDELMSLEFRLDLDEASVEALNEMSKHIQDDFDKIFDHITEIETQVHKLITAVQSD